MAVMVTRITRFWQALMAVMVIASIIFLETITYGPDVDGRTPALTETIQMVAVDVAIVCAFTVAAIALFRWHKFGWWLSIALDGLLALAAASMVVGDFNDRFMATEKGREAFRSDLIIHTTILFASVGAIGLLLLTRKRFLIREAR